MFDAGGAGVATTWIGDEELSREGCEGASSRTDAPSRPWSFLRIPRIDGTNPYLIRIGIADEGILLCSNTSKDQDAEYMGRNGDK